MVRLFLSSLALLFTHLCHVQSLQLCPTFCDPPGLKPIRLFCPWDFPGKNTGVGCHALLLGIFLTQGLKLCLLYCSWILYLLSLGGSPFMHFQAFNYW